MPSILEVAMKMFDPLRKEKAFMLLEVLISLVILSVGLLATLSLTLSSVQGNAFGKRMTVAVTLAQGKLEGLKRLSFSALNPGTTSESNLGANGGSGPYQRFTVVTNNCPVSDMKKIEVIATWSGPYTPEIIPNDCGEVIVTWSGRPDPYIRLTTLVAK